MEGFQQSQASGVQSHSPAGYPPAVALPPQVTGQIQQYEYNKPMPTSTPAPIPTPLGSPPPQHATPEYSGMPYPMVHNTSTMGAQDGHGAHLSQWSAPIFDCFNPLEQCFMACFCPCIVFGKTRARLRDPTLATYDTVNSDCAIWSVLGLCGFSCIYQWISRKEIRARYAIKGDAAEDAVYTVCCAVCALVQEEKELIRRTSSQVPVPPQYATQPPMQMGHTG